MQATVHAFDEAAGTGTVITDDGVVLPFDLPAFLRSGLRRLRVGQRLDVQLADAGGGPARVAEMWLGSLGQVPDGPQSRS